MPGVAGDLESRSGPDGALQQAERSRLGVDALNLLVCEECVDVRGAVLVLPREIAVAIEGMRARLDIEPKRLEVIDGDIRGPSSETSPKRGESGRGCPRV